MADAKKIAHAAISRYLRFSYQQLDLGDVLLAEFTVDYLIALAIVNSEVTCYRFARNPGGQWHLRARVLGHVLYFPPQYTHNVSAEEATAKYMGLIATTVANHGS